MDWKSISQVKEMGVAVEDCPELAADAGKYFDTWWAFSAIAPVSVEVFDPLARIYRRVPPWSALAPPARRAGSPLAAAEFATSFNRENPLSLEISGERGGVFLTGCPDEVRGSGRTWDGDGLVHTIDDARRSMRESWISDQSACIAVKALALRSISRASFQTIRQYGGPRLSTHCSRPR
jgi:phospholipase D3/4